MNQVYSDNSLSIGRTPLVRLNRVGTEVKGVRDVLEQAGREQ